MFPRLLRNAQSAEESSDDLVTGRRAFALEFAIHLVTAFIGPDGTTNQAGGAVVQDDGFGAKPYRRARGPHQQ